LLTVMWMSAALAAIAFSLAVSVRGETDHTSTQVDDLRAYYIADGAIQRAILDMQQGGDAYHAGQARFFYQFPTGDATVEVIPESAKLNVNTLAAEKLFVLLTALGVEANSAQELTQAIVDWRTPASEKVPSIFDLFYAEQTPSFRARHASFGEIEELLSVKGITSDIYYGTYVRDTGLTPPQLVARGGLRDCLSVYGSYGSLDINGAAPAALATLGTPPEIIAEILAKRPFLAQKDFDDFMGAHPNLGTVRMGGYKIFTLRATARLRGADGKPSDLTRSVAATIDLQFDKYPPLVVMRWYDRAA